MKKRIFLPLLCVFSAFLYSNIRSSCTYSGEMDAVSSHSTIFNNSYTETISVILNQQSISNYNSCAVEILQHVYKNDFRSLRFSYDKRGFPLELRATVYLTKKDFLNGKPLFHMSYSQDSSIKPIYNIYDNPEMYHLTITRL